MPSVDERIKLLEKHYVTKEGRRFSTKGRTWVRTAFSAIDGFRLAARDKEHLCEACKTRSGEVLEAFSWEVFDGQKEHMKRSKGACKGLVQVPILVSLLNIPRRMGKSTNVLAWVASTILLCIARSVLYFAAAGDQSARILEDCLFRPLRSDPKLKGLVQLLGEEVRVPSTGSFVRLANTSAKSITGGGYSYIVCDEARDVPAAVFGAAVVSCRDQGGFVCERHPRAMLPDYDPAQVGKKKCPHCGDRMVPWFPRVIVVSSSGVISSADPWFAETVELVERELPDVVYLFHTETAENPSINKFVSESFESTFGRVPSLRTIMDAELNNRWRRKGEDFLTSHEIKRCVVPGLQNLEGSERPCVGFFDASLSKDKTSLVICEEDESSSYPWEVLRVVRIDKWRPETMPGGKIDPAPIQAHFDRYVPMFPSLAVLTVDTRGLEWAKDFALYQQRERPFWGKKIKMLHRKKEAGKLVGARYENVYGGEGDRDLGWQKLEERIAYGKILIPADDDLRAELLGMQKKLMTDGTYKVVDRNRNQSHADVAASLSGCCLLAYRVATDSPRLSFEDVQPKFEEDVARSFRGLTRGFTPNSF